MAAFAAARTWTDDEQVAWLGFGPKIWFTVNGVAVSWRPLRGRCTSPPAPPRLRLVEPERRAAAAVALRDAGLGATEAARVRLGDLGRLAPGAVFVPDLLADPLGVRIPPCGAAGPRLAFLPHVGAIAVRSAVVARHGTDAACSHPREPLLGHAGTEG